MPFGPRHVVGHACHDQNPGNADQDVHGERIRARDQHEVPGKRKKHPGAKDRQPLLAACDDRLQCLPSETGPVSRHHVGKQKSQREKVKHPVRGEVFFVVGNKDIAQQIWDDAGL